MANGNVSFPKIADSSWWKLRELFKKKVPAIITPTYLATALSMSEASARSNLIGPFKKVGIIDDDGKPTDRAYDWRDNNKYKSVCASLIDEYYPQEIKDLFHSPDVDINQVTSWFMNQARCGEPAAKMFARFYILLLKADLNEAATAAAKKDTGKSTVKKKIGNMLTKRGNKSNRLKTPIDPSNESSSAAPRQIVLNNAPELHINIQLHISPESSANQIDKIFESMAKHLKGFGK